MVGGEDFGELPLDVVVPQGMTRGCSPLEILDDFEIEGDETVALVLIDNGNIDVDRNTATLTIVDNGEFSWSASGSSPGWCECLECRKYPRKTCVLSDFTG